MPFVTIICDENYGLHITGGGLENFFFEVGHIKHKNNKCSKINSEHK